MQDVRPPLGREPGESPDEPENETNTKAADENQPFKTPDEVANTDAAQPHDDEADASPKRKWWQLDWPPSKRQIIISAVIAVLAISGAAAFALVGRDKTHSVLTVSSPKHKKVITSPLTGLTVTEKQAKLPVTGVMIENSLQARPQSGLGSAGVVFEAIAEAGITRFLALYQEAEPGSLGPIRSARPYFVRWAQGFDAGYAHVGGSPQALQNIRTWGVRDLDQFYNAGAYHRTTDRYAPHNMYTSMAKLHQLEKSKGYKTSKFTGFPRKKAKPAKQPTARTISFAISSYEYNVRYAYSAKSNTYARFEGGKPHIDANSGKQIRANVVIALVMPYSLEPDGYHSAYKNLGSGKAFIFQDGTVTNAVWRKKSNKAQITFEDGKGNPIKLNAGKTWLTALRSSSEISYKP